MIRHKKTILLISESTKINKPDKNPEHIDDCIKGQRVPPPPPQKTPKSPMPAPKKS
jgi:hypothetical protein